MATALTLVHSPLVGPGTWAALADALRDTGRETWIPDLTGSVSGGPPYLSRQVDTVANVVDSGPTILVGHSGAGPLLAAMGEALGCVEGYVFIDAGLPHPGQSWFDTAPPELTEHLRAMENEGWLPPWSQWWGPDGLKDLIPDTDARERFDAGCPPLPVAMFEEIHPIIQDWPNAPGGYLRLSEAYQDPADHARALGWPVIEQASHHLAVLTDAAAVVESLLELVDQLER